MFSQDTLPPLVFILTVLFFATGKLVAPFMTGLVKPQGEKEPKLPLAMQIVISLAFGGAALYMVLSHSYDQQAKQWAYTTLGAILGFWLRGIPK